MKRLLIVLSILLLGMQTQQVFAAEPDLDSDGIEDSLEATLIEKYAPTYYCHPDERYYPDHVDEYLSHVQMRFHYNYLTDDQILNAGDVNQESLISQEHRNKDWLGNYTLELIRSTDPRDVYRNGGYFLEVPDDSADKESVYAGDLNSERFQIYAHAFRGDHNGIKIQYWVFFPYNEAPSVGGVKLNHEADWEHVTLTLNEDHSIRSIYYASHNNEGKSFTVNELSFSDGSGEDSDSYDEEKGRTHPVVYLALGTHASFPTAGTQNRGWYLPNDYTGKGKLYQGMGRTLNVGEWKHPLNGQSFIDYTGLWGEIGTNIISTGPKTPSQQSSWMSD